MCQGVREIDTEIERRNTKIAKVRERVERVGVCGGGVDRHTDTRMNK